MKRVFLAGLASLSCLVLVQAVHAFAIRRPAVLPAPQRLAQADVVILGKVTAVEDKTVKAERFPGDKEGGEYRVAVVKVSETFFGTPVLTHVKVGFLPPPPPVPPVIQPDDQPVRPIRRPIRPGLGFQQPSLAAGQEAVLQQGDAPVSACRVRVWARFADGRELAEYRDQDLWVVEEVNGERVYFAPERDTVTITLSE